MFCRFPLPFSFACPLLFLLLSSNLVLRVGGVFKLLDGQAKLVSNPKHGVVYLFQFPRTSTTPSQAPYNLMVETWLHWKKIPFHRISNQLFLGSHSTGTAPFAYFNDQYIDGSKEIIKTVGQNLKKYQLVEGEKELMDKILEMFNILMVDRADSLEWMVKDEALVEIIVPQMLTDEQLKAQLSNYSLKMSENFWKRYFDAYNGNGKEREQFVKDFLEEDGKQWTDFSKSLRKVIKGTMEMVLTEKVNGKSNSSNQTGNGQAKLKVYLKKKHLMNENGEYDLKKVTEKLENLWNEMNELIEKNKNKSLYKEEKQQQSMPYAALFGILTQFFETDLNVFTGFSKKEGPLYEFTKEVKKTLGFDDNSKWEALTKRPWQLNFDTEFIFGFTGDDSSKYNGPYKLALFNGLETIDQCISSDNSFVVFSDACKAQYPPEVVESAKALLHIVNEKNSPKAKKQEHAQALFSVLAAYLCNVGKEKSEKSDCGKKHLQKAKEMYKQMGHKREKEFESEMKKARRTVFDTIIAYNDAKTGEAVHEAIVAVRKAVSEVGPEKATELANPADLTNEY
ncbi:hypothetical protein niasHT_021366 [Heterodera trifolii]|uniref:Uncharacterized protein n=1 Tax=Heterodera trifolii TaxID=157864 RepID=A0ABD2K6I4_9BILA